MVNVCKTSFCVQNCMPGQRFCAQNARPAISDGSAPPGARCCTVRDYAPGYHWHYARDDHVKGGKLAATPAACPHDPSRIAATVSIDNLGSLPFGSRGGVCSFYCTTF